MMTVGELADQLRALCVHREMPVVLRCEAEEDLGPCFSITAISIEKSDDGEQFVAIDGSHS
jgi:hypothetical protein